VSAPQLAQRSFKVQIEWQQKEAAWEAKIEGRPKPRVLSVPKKVVFETVEPTKQDLKEAAWKKALAFAFSY
jgi:hypothetical protein